MLDGTGPLGVVGAISTTGAQDDSTTGVEDPSATESEDPSATESEDPRNDRVGATSDKVGAASEHQIVEDLDSGVTPEDLGTELVGSGVTVSNVTFTGASAAGGRFREMGVVGFDSGIVLSTGRAVDVRGPNKADDTTTEFGTPGDPDLDALVAPEQTFDAAVLTLEFVPAGDQIVFDYVFGSEEYNEFVNTEFNDVFAFFVNGVNCATVNGDPVSVNTINGGNPFGTDATRPELYRNNDRNDPGPATLDTEMDGLTVVLECSATVNPGVTNVLKLAIADTADEALDSAVFLRTGSLTAAEPPPPPPQVVFAG